MSGTIATTNGSTPPAGMPMTMPTTTPGTTPGTAVAVTGMGAAGAVTTGTRPDNPFRAIGLLIQAVRQSLEGSKATGEPPRWVRIVRVRQFGDPATGTIEPIAKGVMLAMDGFAKAVAYIQRFTLTAYDLLAQGDGAKALVEVSAAFLKKATEQDFYESIQAAAGVEPPYGASPLADAGPVIDKIVVIADKVPDPEDLDVIGRELYGLLCVELLPLTAALDPKSADHVDQHLTGRLRMIEWGFASLGTGHSITLFNLGSSQPVEISRLGSRHVVEGTADKQPAETRGAWGDAGSTEEVFRLDFAADAQGDIVEANNILTALGYMTPAITDNKLFDAALGQRLRTFQIINGIPVTGALDNATINRLMHMDHQNKTLKRARPYRAADVPAGFDNTKNLA